MGTEQSTNKKPEIQQVTSTSGGLQILKTDVWMAAGFREDSRYGEFKLFNTQDGRHIAIVNKTCHDYTEYVGLCTKLSKAKEINSIPGMVKLLEVSTQEEGNLCSSFYKVTAVYEYFQQVVEDLQQFDTETIKSFMSQMLSTLNDLYSNGISHGDVTPHCILVERTNSGILFKLNNVQQMTGFNQYKRILLAEDCSWHLPPELLDSLSRRELRPNYDIQKSDIYSLALTCLEMGTGNLNDLYDQDTINQNVLHALLDRFRHNHGSQMTTLLSQMLQSDVQSRSTFFDLHQKFTQFRKEETIQIQEEQVQVEKQKKVINMSGSNPQLLSSRQAMSPPQALSSIQNRPIQQALSPTHQPIFKRPIESPPPKISEFKQQAQRENLPEQQQSRDTLPVGNYRILAPQQNNYESTIPQDIKVQTQTRPKNQLFSQKATTTLKRPKHDQNQFRSQVKKSNLKSKY